MPNRFREQSVFHRSGIDAGFAWQRQRKTRLRAEHVRAWGQQLNHLSERVESDIKHLTWDGRRALNQQPRPSATAGSGGEEKEEERMKTRRRKGKWWDHCRNPKLTILEHISLMQNDIIDIRNHWKSYFAVLQNLAKITYLICSQDRQLRLK